jgi:hypothetical protein
MTKTDDKEFPFKHQQKQQQKKKKLKESFSYSLKSKKIEYGSSFLHQFSTILNLGDWKGKRIFHSNFSWVGKFFNYNCHILSCAWNFPSFSTFFSPCLVLRWIIKCGWTVRNQKEQKKKKVRQPTTKETLENDFKYFIK